MVYKLAFIGFGTVGQGLLEILIDKQKLLKEKYDFEWSVVAVSDMLKGSVYNPDGLDPQELLTEVQANNSLSSVHAPEKNWDSLRTIKESNADIIVEVSYTDIETGEPALSHARAALALSKHMVTTNKGPVALAYPELSALAQKNNCEFLFEGTVISGTPVLNLAKNCLAGSDITEVKGIFNGTCNYILTEMEKGLDYKTALTQAQKLGYAEANPDADVLGYDTMAKVVILAQTLMGTTLNKNTIPCEGITSLTPELVATTLKEGYRFKLLGCVSTSADGTTGKVSLEKIALDHPLAGVMGPVNALTFTTDLLGESTIVGAGAGKTETGFALLSDLLEIQRNA